ncbi:hypothetical protein BDZ94DRAFT_1174328 [Collybia nuda]|uniref:Uncharacterized protein n=1 Tax=Collybia nuda TaxID=64659 RepID=A0A9P5XYQ1_9AGAR|nr:hypothetical protein BDZ94DRAFT_1174328 [Collybia nuda]
MNSKHVSPPLSSTRLSRLIYLLALITALLAAYYSYRSIQWKSEVGGWWNLAAVGKRPSQSQSRAKDSCRDRESVEDKINGLAQALGMPPADLASAIAVAVRKYVPPASLSSVAAEESGSAVKAMLGGDEGIQGSEQKHARVVGEAGHASGVMSGVVSGMESFVGMDEP